MVFDCFRGINNQQLAKGSPGKILRETPDSFAPTERVGTSEIAEILALYSLTVSGAPSVVDIRRRSHFHFEIVRGVSIQSAGTSSRTNARDNTVSGKPALR
jgi:hypothetical protein